MTIQGPLNDFAVPRAGWSPSDWAKGAQDARHAVQELCLAVMPSLRGQDYSDRLPQGREIDHVDRYRSAVVFAVLAVVATLGIGWILGPDPAVLIEDEGEALRAELVELRQVPIDEFVSLNDGSAYRWVLGPGFAPPESDGTWVRSQTAQLIFYLPLTGEAAESAFSLELSVSPLLIGEQESRSLVVRSGADEFAVELESGGARVMVPLAPGEQQVVELVCESLDPPAEAALSIDMRRLCVKVYAMAVRKELR